MNSTARNAATRSLDCEHRVIEKVLDALERFVREPAKVPAIVWARALDFLSTFADGLHHAKEEEVLFPELAGYGLSPDSGPIACMLHDHVQGRVLRGAMAVALPMLGVDPESERALSAATAQYVQLLRFHIQKEDNVLFRLADSLLDETAARRVARRFGEVAERQLAGVDVARYFRLADELAAAAEQLGPFAAPLRTLPVDLGCSHGEPGR